MLVQITKRQDGIGKMIKKVEAFIAKHAMIGEKDKIVLGLSGGADSVCLFFLLLELCKSKPFELVVVHLNHGIRGDSAKDDEKFVIDLCDKHDIPCFIYQENIPSIATLRKLSLEEAGREIRREVLEKVLAETGGTKIALAHHQNDNAETLLMNLARGAKMTGMSGIHPINGCYIRPLLCATRKEIETWLDERKIEYCEDKTNVENIQTRNRVRNNIIPLLEEQINKNAVLHVNEAMEEVRQLQEYFDKQVKEIKKKWVEERVEQKIEQKIEQRGEQSQKTLLIKKEIPALFPEICTRQLIRNCLIQITGEEKNLTATHIGAIQELFTKQSGRRLDLPYEVEAIRCYEGVLLQKKIKNGHNAYQYELKIPGVTIIPELNKAITCTIHEQWERPLTKMANLPYTKWLDCDIMKDGLTIRTKKSGDYLVIDEQGNRQKLNRFCINNKIPTTTRDELSLIAAGQEIVWIVGYRVNYRYRVSESTSRVLEINVKLIDQSKQ